MNETKKETVLTLKKIAFIALIAILLNIPLMMIQGVISERDYSQRFVKEEISKTIAENQIISLNPYLHQYNNIILSEILYLV